MLEMNLRMANERVANLEKLGNQLRPGMVSVEKNMFDRLIADNEELKKTKDKLEFDLRKSKEVSSAPVKI